MQNQQANVKKGLFTSHEAIPCKFKFSVCIVSYVLVLKLLISVRILSIERKSTHHLIFLIPLGVQ